MQLFIHQDLIIQGDLMKINNASELVRQLRKVLRATPGYLFYVQDGKYRYQLKLDHWTDKEVFAKIEEKIGYPSKNNSSSLAIALPNKQEKLELIIQKLTEIGIKTIYLRPSERSVMKQLSETKHDRLFKIIQEAIEQSRGWETPEIIFTPSLSALHQHYQLYVFDLKEKSAPLKKNQNSLPLLGIIGPEGGLTDKDYEQFGDSWQTISLGENVLRMETGAIIGGWLIKQGKLPL